MLPSVSQSFRGSNENDGERKMALNRLQSELLILEQEKQKKEKYHMMLVAELRRLEMERDRLLVRIEDKQEEEARFTREILSLDGDVKRLKRKVNLLT